MTKFITTKELAALLKTAGWNASKVTVKCKHSQTYLTVTIRDAAVDVAAVKAFCDKHNTWSMDMSDYVSGQSIEVKTTKEVDAAHAAPFLPAIKATVDSFQGKTGFGLVVVGHPDFMLFNDGRDCQLSERGTHSNDNHSCNHWAADINQEYCQISLALALARCINKKAAREAAELKKVEKVVISSVVFTGVSFQPGTNSPTVHMRAVMSHPPSCKKPGVSTITGDGLPKVAVPAPNPDEPLHITTPENGFHRLCRCVALAFACEV